MKPKILNKSTIAREKWKALEKAEKGIALECNKLYDAYTSMCRVLDRAEWKTWQAESAYYNNKKAKSK